MCASSLGKKSKVVNECASSLDNKSKVGIGECASSLGNKSKVINNECASSLDNKSKVDKRKRKQLTREISFSGLDKLANFFLLLNIN